MRLADLQSCQTNTSFTSSSTSPTSTVVIAKDRLHQVNQQLSIYPKQPSPDNLNPSEKMPDSSQTIRLDGEIKDTLGQLPPMPKKKAHLEFRHRMPLEDPGYQKFNVFTAGSIELGKAIQWQDRMQAFLSHLPITVNNPRRGKWPDLEDPELQTSEVNLQIDWELDAMEQADVICFFFDVNTKSPVTMLELGLWASSEKIVVCCGPKFYRHDNVKRVCERYGIKCVDKLADLPGEVEKMLVNKGMDLDKKTGNLKVPNVHVPKPSCALGKRSH